ACPTLLTALARAASKPSKHQLERETELPFRRGCGGDFSVPAQSRNLTGGGTGRRRHSCARIVERRRVREIECLRAELQLPALRNRKIAEDAGIKIGLARPAQNIAAGVAETDRGDRYEGVRVEVRVPTADAAQNLDIRFHLIGRLRVARRVHTRSRRRDIERSAGDPTEDSVNLPGADNVAGQAGVGKLLTPSERQHVDAVNLQVVRAVEPGW